MTNLYSKTLNKILGKTLCCRKIFVLVLALLPVVSPHGIAAKGAQSQKGWQGGQNTEGAPPMQNEQNGPNEQSAPNLKGPKSPKAPKNTKEAEAPETLETFPAESFREDFARVQKVLRSVPKQILPSVVQLNIIALREQPSGPNFLFDFFNYRNQSPKNSDDLEKSGRYRSNVMGSGLIFHRENNTFFLVTNNHVVEDANQIQVISYNQQKFPAEIVGRDERVDLAVLRFEAPKREAAALRVAALGDSSALATGDWVMAIGSPNGFQSSVTMGIVSYIGRHGGPGQNINDFIQTDAAINRGNSGGPLVNMYGEVVGINTWIASESGSSAGLGFAIPVNNAKTIAESLRTEGKMRYGWLGIVMQEYSRILNYISAELERKILSDYGIYGKNGVLVTDIFPASPAQKAGIRPGDFITAINGKQIRSTEELIFAVGIVPPNEKVQLKFWRGSKYLEVESILRERKTDEMLDAGSLRTWPGIATIPLGQSLLDALSELNLTSQIPTAQRSGLLITRVIPHSRSDLLGLQENDIITEINGQKARSLKDFYRILNEAGPDGQLGYLLLREGREIRAAENENQAMLPK